MRESVTTTRKNGRFFEPIFLILMTTIYCLSSNLESKIYNLEFSSRF